MKLLFGRDTFAALLFVVDDLNDLVLLQTYDLLSKKVELLLGLLQLAFQGLEVFAVNFLVDLNFVFDQLGSGGKVKG